MSVSVGILSVVSAFIKWNSLMLYVHIRRVE